LSQAHVISWAESDLSQIGMDSLSTLETCGNLHFTMQDCPTCVITSPVIGQYNYSALEEFQDRMLEDHMCSEFNFYEGVVNSSGAGVTRLGYYIHQNCTNTKLNSTKSATSRRIFLMSNEEIRLAEMGVWYVFS